GENIHADLDCKKEKELPHLLLEGQRIRHELKKNYSKEHIDLVISGLTVSRTYQGLKHKSISFDLNEASQQERKIQEILNNIVTKLNDSKEIIDSLEIEEDILHCVRRIVIQNISVKELKKQGKDKEAIREILAAESTDNLIYLSDRKRKFLKLSVSLEKGWEITSDFFEKAMPVIEEIYRDEVAGEYVPEGVREEIYRINTIIEEHVALQDEEFIPKEITKSVKKLRRRKDVSDQLINRICGQRLILKAFEYFSGVDISDCAEEIDVPSLTGDIFNDPDQLEVIGDVVTYFLKMYLRLDELKGIELTPEEKKQALFRISVYEIKMLEQEGMEIESLRKLLKGNKGEIRRIIKEKQSSKEEECLSVVKPEGQELDLEVYKREDKGEPTIQVDKKENEEGESYDRQPELENVPDDIAGIAEITDILEEKGKKMDFWELKKTLYDNEDPLIGDNEDEFGEGEHAEIVKFDLDSQYVHLGTYINEPTMNNRALYFARKQQIKIMRDRGINLRMLDKIIGLQLSHREKVDNLKGKVFDFYFQMYMYSLYPTKICRLQEWDESLENIYQNLEEKEKRVLSDRGISNFEMYKNFSETLLRLIEGEKKQTVTIGKGDFSIRKAGLILLAGEDKRTQEKTFIIYLPGINLAQRVKLDEATGNCLPVGGLLSFEHGSQGMEMLRLFDKLVKLPQWSPWDERPRVLEMFSPAQLLRLTQIGFNVIDINYLASRKIDCKSVIEKLGKIGAISEYGYLKLYVLSGREKDFFERIEGIEKVCGENQGFNYYSVNYVLGLFYQWSDWVKKTSEKEGTKFFVRIPDIVNFELWIERLNKRPIEIEYWNKHELENNFRGSERRKWIERCNINSKQKYEDLAKAIIKVILRDKISITLGDIEVKREDIKVFTYRTSKSGRWSYCFYDKKNRLSVVVGDNDKLLLLSDMMPIGFKNGKIMNVMPIFDGSNPGVWKDDLIRKYLA
ncbi:MAG: hypothetical protein KAJ14_14255, partial [Candidatus Omnitrophica bacterium]|nr:hypothetical protein [Candidatus Omnitrophota bacterium]